MKNTWENRLLNKCHPLNIEFQKYLDGEGRKRILFCCAKLPSDKQKKELKKLIPSDVTVRNEDFEERPKESTRYAVEMHLIRNGLLSGKIQMGNRDILLITIRGIDMKVGNRKFYLSLPNTKDLPEDDPFWKDMDHVLANDGYFDSWEIIIGEKKHAVDLKLSNEVSENKEKRREKITKDNVTDIHIILNDPNMTWDKLMEEL